MYRKTEGIVLREVQYRDSDKLLTVLTRDFGRITVAARGAKRSGGRLFGACQLLAYSEFTLLERQGRLTVTEATPLELFPELRDDLELLSLASYFAQVAETLAPEDDPFSPVLPLLLNSLFALARLHLEQALVKAAFEFRIVCLSGFEPDLCGCAACGGETPTFFNISQGTLLCADCARESSDGIRMPLSPASLEALRYIAYADPKRLFSFRLSGAALRETGNIAESYLCTRLERGFSTLDFYKSLFI